MFGPLPPRRLPQQNAERTRLLADRWWRASMAQTKWAESAKECVDFLEGRQWTEAQLRELARQRRPALKFNKIAPLVRLVLGYMRNNRTDITYLPANDGPGTEPVAEILTKIVKQIGERNQLPWVDAEVFMDGVTTGRGFYDHRLSFKDNDLGEVQIKAVDPFTVFIDPDADSYDLNDAKHVTVSRWVDIEEIEFTYGPDAAALVKPFVGSQAATWGGFPFLDISGPEVTPIRSFGQVEDRSLLPFQDFFHTELIDRTRKSVRVIDQQHYVTKWGPTFIDLETGDMLPVPAHFTRVEVEKALAHAAALGNPMVVDTRPIRRVRWTVMIGDAVVFDDWSIYQSYSLTGFFPYFRRGVTRGMIEDLLDPQREINKRRSAEIEIVGRSAHSGFLYHEKGVSPEMKALIKAKGSDPGINIEWTGDAHMKPERIQPAAPPTAMERLEQKANDDMRQISGVNEAALGIDDKVQSGRAWEARQRQAVIGIQMYLDNFSRSKELLGRRQLEMVQRHYSEERVFRIVGEGGQTEQIWINRLTDPATGATLADRLNDITIGRYTVAVDEHPLSATFANAQFEEMMMLLQKLGPLGQALIQLRPDLVVDLSSLPRKEEWKQALIAAAQAVAGQQAAAAAAEGEVPPEGAPPAGPGAPLPAPAGGNVVALR